MKKLVSLILAVLMLLSVFAMAEANTGATEGIQSDAEFYAKASPCRTSRTPTGPAS